MDRAVFNTLFSADWLFGEGAVSRIFPRRWEALHRRLNETAASSGDGETRAVDRRRGLSAEEFRREYFLTGTPVVLEGAAEEWGAVKKWNLEYLRQVCGEDEVPVLDGQNWIANHDRSKEAVSTTETKVKLRDLLTIVESGGAWYAPFLEILHQYPTLREDIDYSFVKKYGCAHSWLPWQNNILSKMYIGGANTATSFHCAPVSNLFLQVYGRKKWTLVAPQFTPFMYTASNRGVNWQSRVDFRSPDSEKTPLYRYVHRYETILEPGDILWNPPLVWHGVINLTKSIAVSMWWFNTTRAVRNNPFLTALSFAGIPGLALKRLGIGGSGKIKSSFQVHLNR
jgi:hypothetical protein